MVLIPPKRVLYAIQLNIVSIRVLSKQVVTFDRIQSMVQSSPKPPDGTLGFVLSVQRLYVKTSTGWRLVIVSYRPNILHLNPIYLPFFTVLRFGSHVAWKNDPE